MNKLNDEIYLIEAVLRGFPQSMAKSDAERSCRNLRMSIVSDQLFGFSREDLTDVADGLAVQPATIDVGDDVPQPESTESYLCRFIRAALSATAQGGNQ